MVCIVDWIDSEGGARGGIGRSPKERGCGLVATTSAGAVVEDCIDACIRASRLAAEDVPLEAST